MKRTLKIMKDVLTWIVVVFAVCMMIFTLVSVNFFNERDRDLFGYKIFIVNSPSMAATDFDTDDAILVKEIKDVTDLKEGDIISFISQNPDSRGETVTHKIRKVTTDERGNRAFQTYGTSNKTDDVALVTETYLIGQYNGVTIPKLGVFFRFLKSTPGYILCVLIPFLLIILSEGIRCLSIFRSYKKEQQQEMAAERAKLEEERAESRRMMEELMELKKQLADRTSASDSTVTAESADASDASAES